jgi:ornithine cyclodeaminase/alanine dehydrogenase-like protein (mu-crystallin family)
MATEITEAQIRPLLDPGEVRAAVESALRLYSRGDADQPLRTMVSVKQHSGFLGVTPSYAGALGVKIITFYPGHPQNSRPFTGILMFNPCDGTLRATLDASFLSSIRTAAVSAAAVNILARQDASTLAIIGAGALAGPHLEAFRQVRRIGDVRVFSKRGGAEFAEAHGVTLAASAQDAITGADIVLTATDSATPVLDGSWLAPGAMVCAVGAPRASMRELDDKTIARAGRQIYVDSREAASSESGDVIKAGHIQAELGELLNGTAPGMESDGNIVIFKSMGMAVQDIAVADMVCCKLGV